MVAIARDIFLPTGLPLGLEQSGFGKLNLSGQLVFGTHRSGWRYALEGLQRLHHPNGILFDGYIENTFGWRIDEAAERGEIPYRSPWVGIAHHPQNMPQFLEYRTAPQQVFNNYYMTESLENCRGIYVLSDYHGEWLSDLLGPDIPIQKLVHPTETPETGFEIENFLFNQEKQIVSLGHWLRKLSSIKQLPTARYPKQWLVAETYSKEVQGRERFTYNFTNEYGLEIVGSYSEIDWLENDAYDKLLSENIVFLDYFDCSASNTIIECIVRNTPCLVNRHPAIVEYLGADYPFYYDSLEEAAHKVENFELIEDTFDYLEEMDKTMFTQAHFCESIESSAIYKALPDNFEQSLPAPKPVAPVDTLGDLNILHGGPIEREFVFVVCFRNIDWKLLRCIRSICDQQQAYSFGVVLIEDCSDEEMDTRAARALLDDQEIDYVYVQNKDRKYLCRNLYNATNLLVVSADSVVIQVDGDDLLADTDVLGTLEQAYAEGAQMTFGCFEAISDKTVGENIRNWTGPRNTALHDPWDIDLCCTWVHLKTWRKSLWGRVPMAYFLENSGEGWLKTGEDISIQPKMAELAIQAVRYIDEVLYIYDLSGSDHELLDASRAEYIATNLYRLPKGTYVGECRLRVQRSKQEARMAERASA